MLTGIFNLVSMCNFTKEYYGCVLDNVYRYSNQSNPEIEIIQVLFLIAFLLRNEVKTPLPPPNLTFLLRLNDVPKIQGTL